MLTTLLRPSGGQAAIAGYDLLHQAAHVRQHIGYVSQAGGADASATGIENIILQARIYGMSLSEASERAQALIHALELGSCATRLVKTFSGGQRRRLDLALGMVHKPRLLFLDEPTASLDPQSRARLWDEVRHLRDEGVTIFLTTHYLEEADTLCNQLSIIDHGEIVAEGAPDLLKRQIAGDVITLGLNVRNGDLTRAQDLLHLQPFVRELHGIDDGLRLYVDQGEQVLPTILRAIDGAGLSIRTIALARPTLEDVFLRQTGRSLRETNGNREN
jgi:ABC-2 type transport system ATP-binding protein